VITPSTAGPFVDRRPATIVEPRSRRSSRLAPGAKTTNVLLLADAQRQPRRVKMRWSWRFPLQSEDFLDKQP
jgi:hypothetical protein